MRPEPTIVQRAAEIHGTRRRLVFGFAAAAASGACMRSYSANKYSTRSRSDVKRFRL